MKEKKRQENDKKETRDRNELIQTKRTNRQSKERKIYENEVNKKKECNKQ